MCSYVYYLLFVVVFFYHMPLSVFNVSKYLYNYAKSNEMIIFFAGFIPN